MGTLAYHLYIGAKRKPGDLVQRLTPAKAAAGNGWPETDAEGLDMDVAPLGDGEVAQLVNEDHEAEAGRHQGDADHAAQAEFLKERDQADRDQQQENGLGRVPAPG